jgi:LAO/AO transport system kinase
MPISSADLVARLKKGDLRAASRLMSRAESNDDETLSSLGAIYRAAGRAHIVGLTGVPGSGKSTLVSKLVETIRKDGRRVGVIAIDPSSPFSGGAILGDRIRMTNLVMDEGVFIRSMATRGSTGGLARSALTAVDILDTVGFDVIIIETVGVGQDEVEIAKASHSTLVVSAPGLGDDVQAIKAGILEIADIHVVSKCDRSDSNRTITDLKIMLAMGVNIAIKDRGGKPRLRNIAEYRTFKTAEDLLRSQFYKSTNKRIQDVVEQIARRELDPFTASNDLLKKIAF